MAGLPNDTFERLKAILLAAPHEIALPNGEVALVDCADAPLVAGYDWRKMGRYVAAYSGNKTILLHRFLMPNCRMVDHEDGDGLNNQRHNLREANCYQNAQNRNRTRGSSRFKGVNWDAQRGAWRAQIVAFGVKKTIGRYTTEAAAARAYDKAARVLHGEFAKTNRDLGLY